MSEMSREELLKIEAAGSEQGWVMPLTKEDKEYFAYLRKVFKRYNIVPFLSLLGTKITRQNTFLQAKNVLY